MGASASLAMTLLCSIFPSFAASTMRARMAYLDFIESIAASLFQWSG
jgi:hypothetical protein